MQEEEDIQNVTKWKYAVEHFAFLHMIRLKCLMELNEDNHYLKHFSNFLGISLCPLFKNKHSLQMRGKLEYML